MPPKTTPVETSDEGAFDRGFLALALHLNRLRLMSLQNLRQHHHGDLDQAQIASALKWRETINNRLTSWMAPIKDDEEPHDALLRLLEFEQRAFNDPAVSDSAAYLVAETKRDALREAADLCDQLSEQTGGICAIAIREMADEVERDCP